MFLIFAQSRARKRPGIRQAQPPFPPRGRQPDQRQIPAPVLQATLSMLLGSLQQFWWELLNSLKLPLPTLENVSLCLHRPVTRRLSGSK